jgi:biotin operon repressor
MSLDEHTDTDRPDHEIAKAQLRRTLLSDCVGKQNATSGSDLAAETPVSESTIRDLIAELRQDEELPVYSLGQGYFVIATSDEFRECISRIDDEIATRQQTKRALYNSVR